MNVYQQTMFEEERMGVGGSGRLHCFERSKRWWPSAVVVA